MTDVLCVHRWSMMAHVEESDPPYTVYRCRGCQEVWVSPREKEPEVVVGRIR